MSLELDPFLVGMCLGAAAAGYVWALLLMWGEQ